MRQTRYGEWVQVIDQPQLFWQVASGRWKCWNNPTAAKRAKLRP